MNPASQHNIGSYIAVHRGSAAFTATAAGTGDATTVTGQTIDRAIANMPLSAVFSTLFDSTLASGATLSVTTTIQDSADNSNWSTYQTEAATVVATGPSGGGAVNGHHSISVDLSAARRYVRQLTFPDLSAAGTDTLTGRVAIALGGVSQLPSVA